MEDSGNPDVLFQEMKNGNREAYAQIYQLYFTNLYEYGLRLACEKDLVMDSIHDLFVKIWTKRNDLGVVENLKAYLLVSLRRILNNKLQSGKKTRSVNPEDDLFFELRFSTESQYFKKLEETDRRQRLLQAMDQLSPRQKEMIYLRYFEELGYDEIASVMDITIKGAYKLSARSLESLRDMLSISTTALLILLALVREEVLNVI